MGWQYCAVCARPLERVTVDDVTTGWHHQREGEAADHIAVPVDYSEVRAVHRCDICDQGGVTHEIDAASFQHPWPSDNHLSVGGWAFCSPCADAVREALSTRNVTPLTQRSALVSTETDPRVIAFARKLYGKLLVNRRSDVQVIPQTGPSFIGDRDERA